LTIGADDSNVVARAFRCRVSVDLATIVAATGTNLSLMSVDLSLAGDYSIVVSNALGSVTSPAARMTVTPAPTQPGSVDLSFRPDAALSEWRGSKLVGVTALDVQADGKVVLAAGYSSGSQIDSMGLVRLNRDGHVDASFDRGSGVPGNIASLLVQPDGKLLIAGVFFEINGSQRATIARLNADGTVDPTFDPGSGASYMIHEATIQADGKITIMGEFASLIVCLAKASRVNSDGSLDTTFDPGTNATVAASGLLRSMALQSDNIYSSSVVPLQQRDRSRVVLWLMPMVHWTGVLVASSGLPGRWKSPCSRMGNCRRLLYRNQRCACSHIAR
jgi:uncharacterized delta-60 repeat protein